MSIRYRYRKKSVFAGSRGLGQGGRTYRFRTTRRRRRQFVPRTLGPQTGESKYFDTTIDDFTCDENAAWTATADVIKGTFCLPVQGTSVQNRVGRRIELYKVSVRGTIAMTTLAAQGAMLDSPSFRCILWVDTQCNGSVTTSASLMQAPGAARVVIAIVPLTLTL